MTPHNILSLPGINITSIYVNYCFLHLKVKAENSGQGLFCYCGYAKPCWKFLKKLSAFHFPDNHTHSSPCWELKWQKKQHWSPSKCCCLSSRIYPTAWEVFHWAHQFQAGMLKTHGLMLPNTPQLQWNTRVGSAVSGITLACWAAPAWSPVLRARLPPSSVTAKGINEQGLLCRRDFPVMSSWERVEKWFVTTIQHWNVSACNPIAKFPHLYLWRVKEQVKYNGRGFYFKYLSCASWFWGWIQATMCFQIITLLSYLELLSGFCKRNMPSVG